MSQEWFIRLRWIRPLSHTDNTLRNVYLMFCAQLSPFCYFSRLIDGAFNYECIWSMFIIRDSNTCLIKENARNVSLSKAIPPVLWFYNKLSELLFSMTQTESFSICLALSFSSARSPRGHYHSNHGSRFPWSHQRPYWSVSTGMAALGSFGDQTRQPVDDLKYDIQGKNSRALAARISHMLIWSICYVYH